MSLRSSLAWLVLALALLAAPAHARVTWHADAMAMPGVTVDDVTLSLVPGEGGSLAVDLTVARVDVAALGWHRVRLGCRGTLVRAAPGQWHFKGTLDLHGSPGDLFSSAAISLLLDHGENTLDLTLQQASHRLQVAWPLDDLGHMQVHLRSFPMRWLQGLLEQLWPQGTLGQGTLDAGLSLDLDDDRLRSSGQYALTDADFDSSDGKLAGAGIDSQGHWTMALRDDHASLDLNARLHGGELLLGPVYARLPDAPVRVRVGLDSSDAGIRIHRLHYDDGSMLRFDGRASFDEDGGLQRFRVDAMRAVFPDAYLHYGKSLLAAAGFSNLDLRGMVTASGAWDQDGWQRFRVDARGLSLADPLDRIGVDGLTGHVDWARSGTREPGSLSWNRLALLGLSLGPAATRWRSHDGTLSLVEPATVPMMGGKVFLRALDWSPVADKREQRIAASLAYAGIELSRLSQAFGWPAFEGTVAGAIPGIDYNGERLSLEGGVSVNVFGGFVDVTQLVLSEPLGPAPLLQASVDFRDLELKPMTAVFGFGSISGALHGHVHDLRMVAWRPVAFSAALLADEGGEISQRAINSISTLGGGGIVGGLQSAILNIFEDFNYARIGLRCVLRDGVCHMSGLGEAEDGGYLIVEGSGLPRIAVIGHQHQVDWQTLVTRLQAATSGGGVKIQ